MLDLGRGIVAGCLATVVISLISIMRLAAGIMEWFSPVGVMNQAVQTLFDVGTNDPFGWVTHFIVGTFIWGSLFGLSARHLPGRSYTFRGLLFGVIAWLVVMFTLFPAAGAGLFGFGYGAIIPLGTLISHLIYGLVLGATFGWLRTLE